MGEVKDFENLCKAVKDGNVTVELYEYVLNQRDNVQKQLDKANQDFDTRTMLVEALEAIIVQSNDCQMMAQMAEAIKKYC